jgi:hypothetical protein
MLSVGYQQEADDFVANTVFPAIPVTNRSDVYFVYNRGDFFRNNMQKRAPGTPAAAAGYKLTTKTYIADVWAEKKLIDDQIRANSDSPLQPDRDATMWLTQQALINRDVNWATAYFTTGLWGGERAGQAAADATHVRYWNLSGSTPIEDILAGQLAIKGATGKWPNVLVLGAQVYISLLTNPEIIDRLKYGQTAPGAVVVKATDLAALFQVKKVVVMSGIQTTSAEDLVADSDTTPDTFAFISGKHALLAYAADSPGIMQASAGYTFNWTGLTGATAAGMRIKKFRWEVDAADHVEIEQAYAFGLVSKYLGFFFKDVIQ